jgi:archaellum component FlaC
MPEETKKERLSRLEQELKEVKATLPEHCSGTAGYVSVHHASTTHWQRIEDLEEQIEKLKAELDS